MSSHYSAHQYNDTFTAKHLGNWQYGTNHPGKHPRKRTGRIIPIAFNNGHLFPGVKRDPTSSPWGDYRSWIWEETNNCDCVDRIRHPEHYDRPPCSIIVTREKPCHLMEAKETAQALSQQLFNSPQN